jgi:hypothetical protein
LLRYVEQDLSCWGVLQLDLGDEAFQHLMSTRDRDNGLTAESIDNRVETERHKRIWGEWCGREADFFVRCAELVERLS